MKTNKQDAQARLSTLESLVNDQLTEIEALRKIIEAPPPVKGLWKPTESGQGYSYVNAYEGVRNTSYQSGHDRRIIESGNCFPSYEVAEKAAPLMARCNKFIAAGLMADPDAGAFDAGRRHTVLLEDGAWKGKYFYTSSFPVYVHTIAQADEMAAILNAEGVK